MLVSAISSSNAISNVSYYNRSNDISYERSLKSVTPYFSRNDTPEDEEDLSTIYDNVNQWKKFCEHCAPGTKLNVIA